MVAAVVRMRFVAPQVWIGLDVLGFSFETAWDGHLVRLSIPSTPGEFSDLHDGSTEPPLPSLAESGPVFAEPDRDARTAALVIFEVVVELETTFPARKPAEPSPYLRRIAEDDLRTGIGAATGVAGLFMRHLRAAAPQQSWLGLSTHDPVQYGIAQLEYASTGQRIFGLGAELTVTMRSSRLRVETSDLESIATEIGARNEPAVTRSLLADAWHLADAAAANDQDRATLVAATACEVKVKQTIRQRLTGNELRMAEHIIRRRSNLPELLDKDLFATLGLSLRTASPELYRRIEALARQRNAIVHGGQRDPLVKDAHAPAQIASSLFDWLEGL